MTTPDINSNWIIPNSNALKMKWYEHILCFGFVILQIGLNILAPGGVMVNPWKHEKTDRVWKALPMTFQKESREE